MEMQGQIFTAWIQYYELIIQIKWLKNETNMIIWI